MAFDWVGFLQHHAVQYVTSGKNVARGHIGLHCPFCGPADPSRHMGIELKTGYWGCWRNPGHRGKSPERLMVALTNLTWAEAHALVDSGEPLERLSLKELAKRAAAIGNVAPVPGLKPMKFPPEFRKIKPDGSRGQFFDYVVSRGFPVGDVPAVCRTFRLRCAVHGKQHHRVIIPLIRGGGVYGWTGRAVHPGADLRYLTEPGGAQAKRLVFNHDAMEDGGRALVIVEGPLDAIKLDFYARKVNVRAVGAMTTSLTPEQIATLLAYAPRFERTFILLDPGAFGQSLFMQSQLSAIRPAVLRVPEDRKFYVRPKDQDPGGFTPQGVLDYANGWIFPRLV